MCTTNISNNKVLKIPEKRASLDTLAQLTTTDPESGKEKLTKRQIAKAITLGQLYPLIDLNSPLKKSYWRTYHCNRIIVQDGFKYTTEYCNGRWCTVCNRIRMAKMINGYSVPLLKIHDLQFVTLTAPNVKGSDLKNEIATMYKKWRGINQNMRKTYKMNIQGLRKLECTYNPKTDTYNPHFHFLIGGQSEAEQLVKLWLDKNPKASIKAQNITKSRDGSIIELFKYAVKGVHKGKFYPQALDQIYQALYGKRTFQSFGISKQIEEDLDGIKSEELTFKGFNNSIWQWSNECKDWVNSDGELLTEYVLDGKLSDWIEDLTKELEVGQIVEPEQEQTTIRLSKDQKEDILWQNYSEMADSVIDSS